jgi:hypothetical protein
MNPYYGIAVIDYPIYEKAFQSRLRGDSSWIAFLRMNWLHASWRAGWTDAGQEAHLHPELLLDAKRRSRKKK